MADQLLSKKGNTVALITFNGWQLNQIFGRKTDENGSQVNFVWCKVCARHKHTIMSSPHVKGSARQAAIAFIDGTTSVTKYQVHLCLFTNSHPVMEYFWTSRSCASQSGYNIKYNIGIGIVATIQ